MVLQPPRKRSGFIACVGSNPTTSATIKENAMIEYNIPPETSQVATFENIEAYSVINESWETVPGKYVRKFWLYPDGTDGGGGYGEYIKWRK